MSWQREEGQTEHTSNELELLKEADGNTNLKNNKPYRYLNTVKRDCGAKNDFPSNSSIDKLKEKMITAEIQISSLENQGQQIASSTEQNYRDGNQGKNGSWRADLMT